MSEATMFAPVRWSDRDRYVGPFTFARGRQGARGFAFVLTAPANDDGMGRGCFLRLTVRGHTVLVSLPPILRPWREQVRAVSWDAETIARLGRDWYWSEERREIGVSLHEGHMSVSYGRQSDDSRTERRRGYFLPWTQWRHVRHSVYGLDGEHIASEPPRPRGGDHDAAMEVWRAWHDRVQATPARGFAFLDFDGESLTATTRIEEREWRFGTGSFRWLSLFRRARVHRSLDIRFSGETGERKGSWKGGTIGHSIEMQSGELHEAAFRRYCAAHDMTFVGPIPDYEAAHV